MFLPGLSVQESNIAIDKYNQLAYEVGCLCGLVNKCLLVSTVSWLYFYDMHKVFEEIQLEIGFIEKMRTT